MRTMRYVVCLVMISSIFHLYGESATYQQWIARRDALKQDKSVVRYYTFEEVVDSKSIVKDLSGHGGDLKFVAYKDKETGQIYDDLQVIEGRWPEKKAVRLDRGWYETEAYNIENNQFTAEVWFRRQGPGSILPANKRKNGTILSVSGYSQGWRIVTAYEQSSTIGFEIGQPNGATTIYAKMPLADNVWHHLVVTFDGCNMKMYIDGQLAQCTMSARNDKKETVKAERFTGQYVPSKIPFKIGYSEHGVGSVKLDIDEVVIYNRVLQQDDISVSQEDIFLKADGYIRQKDYKKARVEYERLKGLPGYGTEIALFNIAESYLLEKNYVNAHKTYGEILDLANLSDYYRIDALFRQADVYVEQKDYNKARQLYQKVLDVPGALTHHLYTAQLKTGDTYKAERKYSVAQDIYKKLLMSEETSNYPHEGHRREIIDRLEEIDGLADDVVIKSRQEKIVEWVNRPKQAIYVSLNGNDDNAGTKNKPFATIKRAQQEVKKLKEKGMPAGGIVVYLRGGRYFLQEGLLFGKDDSGTDTAPVVYRSYPGEQVRIIGGKQITNFTPLTDETILKRLPEEARGKVWVADLKQAGITEYGHLVNISEIKSGPHGMELFCNGRSMWLARWPNEGHARVAALTAKDGEMPGRGPYQLGKFVYAGDRPERWLEEKDAWLVGFWYFVFSKAHIQIASIDTREKTISLVSKQQPVGKDVPYYAYNLLCELDVAGEWYLDRETGKLYFYPPDEPGKSELIVSTLDAPVLRMENASNVVVSGLVCECSWRNAIEIKGGRNNLIAGCVIRDVGQWGVIVDGGWEHSIVGCDIYDIGAGGISLYGGDRVNLIPGKHLADNNYIHHFDRFDQQYRQGVSIDGCGQRVSHNIIHDSPMQGIYFNAMDHVIEFNEIHDVVHEGRELGAIYVYGAHDNWRWMNRGTIIRNNFIHHISYHCSPNTSQGLNCIHVDGRNGGMVIEKNIFYRFSEGISCSHPHMRLENNILIDAERVAIGLGERGMEFFMDANNNPVMSNIEPWARKLQTVRYKQPPWNYRYPQLVGALMERYPMKTKDTVVERNVNTGGPFLSLGGVSKEDNQVINNWDGDDPLFLDKESMNFNIRPGSPVYGLTGCEPITMDGIGVYKDPLRASWPINRTQSDIGKYYRVNWTPLAQQSHTSMSPMARVSKAREFIIPKKINDIVIDGRLEKGEWLGLDVDKAMVISEYFTGEKKEGPNSYVWLLYEDRYLYVAAKHEADPFVEGMSMKLKDFQDGWLEVDIESQMGPHSRRWWSDDMATGPIYSITGRREGKLTVNNMFQMPHQYVKRLEEAIEYKATILDKEKDEWVCEMKIPLNEIGINPIDVARLSFNVGTYRRSGCFAWVATGSSIWRVENAGFISFAK